MKRSAAAAHTPLHGCLSKPEQLPGKRLGLSPPQIQQHGTRCGKNSRKCEGG